MKLFRIEKVSTTNDRFNETFLFNLDVTTRVKITPEDIEIFCGTNDSKRFTRKELGETEYLRISEAFRQMQ